MSWRIMRTQITININKHLFFQFLALTLFNRWDKLDQGFHEIGQMHRNEPVLSTLWFCGDILGQPPQTQLARSFSEIYGIYGWLGIQGNKDAIAPPESRKNDLLFKRFLWYRTSWTGAVWSEKNSQCAAIWIESKPSKTPGFWRKNGWAPEKGKEAWHVMRCVFHCFSNPNGRIFPDQR